jgi:hypothetical protein
VNLHPLKTPALLGDRMLGLFLRESHTELHRVGRVGRVTSMDKPYGAQG